MALNILLTDALKPADLGKDLPETTRLVDVDPAELLSIRLPELLAVHSGLILARSNDEGSFAAEILCRGESENGCDTSLLRVQQLVTRSTDYWQWMTYHEHYISRMLVFHEASLAHCLGTLCLGMFKESAYLSKRPWVVRWYPVSQLVQYLGRERSTRQALALYAHRRA